MLNKIIKMILILMVINPSLFAATNYIGTWTLKGIHSIKGQFVGKLEIRKINDSQVNVIRIVDYLDYFHEGQNIEEIWTGIGAIQNDSLTIDYGIKKADFILKLDNDFRKNKDYSDITFIHSIYNEINNNLMSEFSDLENGTIYEEILNRENLTDKVIWSNEKVLLAAEGSLSFSSKLARLVIMTYFKNKVKNYWDDPFIKKFKNRLEYISGNHFFVFDPTDYQFYQKNKNVLRVENKIIDKISLMESKVRQSAYGHKLAEKAAGFDKNYLENHMTPQGLLAEAAVTDNGKFESFIGNNDGALWTGVYVASQALKYLTLKNDNFIEADLALENVKKSTRGLFLLMDIEANKKEFARTVVPANPNNLGEPWRHGVGQFAHLDYIYGGNNDMIKGLLSGFLWAALTVPRDDTLFWDELKAHSLNLINLSVVGKSMNLPLALGVAAVITEDPKLRDAYENFYIIRGKNLSEYTNSLFKHLIDPTYWDYKLNINIQWPGYLGTSGIHLTTITNITQILIAEKLGNLKMVNALRKNLIGEWLAYYGLQRHLLSISAYAFGSKVAPSENSKWGVKDISEKWSNSMDKALWGLREFPYPRPRENIEIDYSKRPDWCLSPMPRDPENAADSPPIEHYFQGLYEYPIFQNAAWGNDYVWKSSVYTFKNSASKNIEYSSADYLFSYWLARWSGFISEYD